MPYFLNTLELLQVLERQYIIKMMISKTKSVKVGGLSDVSSEFS